MPNRASALSAEPVTPGRDSGLSREAIVRTGIELADRGGLGAVSIRRIAAALGVRPMSLYTYVASKQDLLTLMADEVVADEMVPAELPEGWREALRAIARNSHAAFVAHSWVVELAGCRSRLGPGAPLQAEQLLTAIAPLRLSPGAAWTVLFIVSDYTAGHAMRVTSSGDAGYPSVDLARCPNLSAVLEAAPDHGAATFEDGLDILLDGIARRFTW